MTINQYLQATLTNFTFSDVFIEKALLKYGITSGADAADIGERERDLSEAEMWDAAAGFISGGGGLVKIDNRSVGNSSFSATQSDRAAWRSKADALRAKWGEVSVDSGIIYDASNLW